MSRLRGTVVIRRLLLGAAVSVVLFMVGIVGLGWKPYVVTSESMSPALHAPGDLILVDPKARSLAVYEIVTYTDPRGLVTHRVIGQAEDGTFTVKGDANERPDSRPFERRQVVGRSVSSCRTSAGPSSRSARTRSRSPSAPILAIVWPRRRMLRIIVLVGLVAFVSMVPTTVALPPEIHPPSLTSGLLRPDGDLAVGRRALARRASRGPRSPPDPPRYGRSRAPSRPSGRWSPPSACRRGRWRRREHRRRALVAELHPASTGCCRCAPCSRSRAIACTARLSAVGPGRAIPAR